MLGYVAKDRVALIMINDESILPFIAHTLDNESNEESGREQEREREIGEERVRFIGQCRLL